MPTPQPTDEVMAAIQVALGVAARRARDLSLQEAVGTRAGYALEGPLHSTLSRLALATRCTMSELAEQCGLELSTVSRRVRTLEERGLVERETSPTDRRAVHLQLTAEGRRQFQALSTTWRSMLADVVAGWAPGDVARFADLFDRFARDLEGYAVHTLALTPLAAIPDPPTAPGDT